MVTRLKNFLKENKLLLGISLWISMYIFAHDYNVCRNRRVYFSNPVPYKTEEEFLIDLEKEKSKLGLEDVTIVCDDDSSILGGHCFKKGYKKYLIKFNPHYKTLLVLKHEMYHVKKYENFSLDDLLDGILLGEYEEWKATNYSLEE